MIQRFRIFENGLINKHKRGEWVSFFDAETDKAETVADVTAELIGLLFEAAGYTRGELKLFKGHRLFESGPIGTVWADKMVAIGRWVKLEDDGAYQCYRPVEPQDSGDTDG